MSTARDPEGTGAAARARRTAALIRKETLQLLRDPSSIAMGVVMPLVLILLFGYGLSLDVKDVRVAIVLEEDSADATALAGRFQLSEYFAPEFVTTWPEAQERILAREVDGALRVPADFSRRLGAGDATLQLVVNGSDANRARIIQGYVQALVRRWALDSQEPRAGAVVVDRMWFNESNDSRYFLVPGLVVLVMTLIGAFMTALVVAREWERGTLEALFATPVRIGEFLLSKLVPYFVLGMLGFALCLSAAVFLFEVPLRGSLAVLVLVSMAYLLVALGLGLLISTLVKSQFVASQIALIATFLPALLLSGFLFDPRSMPPFVRAITYVLPAKYYVSLLQTIFLAGDVWAVILPNTLVLVGMAALVLALTRLATRKELA